MSDHPVIHVRLSAAVHRPRPRKGEARELARRLGIDGGAAETLYDGLEVPLGPGRIVAVIGPSGAGKSVLLRELARRVRGAIRLPLAELSRDSRPALLAVDPKRRFGRMRRNARGRARSRSGSRRSARTRTPLAQRLSALSICGLAEGRALLTPARHLSGGQLYRLALAWALLAAQQRALRLWGTSCRSHTQPRAAGPHVPASRVAHPPSGVCFPQGRKQTQPRASGLHVSAGAFPLILADEFASCLDAATAQMLCLQVRKFIARTGAAMVVATPREELLPYLRPDAAIVKPLGGDARIVPAAEVAPPSQAPADWPIEQGAIADYRSLAAFHYVAGPPAAHKRVYVIRPPQALRRPAGAAQQAAVPVAAVLVVSPPAACVAGRNYATRGRYVGPRGRADMARLNAEVECISRVVVHPIYRGCGLAVRLVRHALATAQRPLVEALASMGLIHPLFRISGMRCFGGDLGRRHYCYYLARTT